MLSRTRDRNYSLLCTNGHAGLFQSRSCGVPAERAQTQETGASKLHYTIQTEAMRLYNLGHYTVMLFEEWTTMTTSTSLQKSIASSSNIYKQRLIPRRICHNRSHFILGFFFSPSDLDIMANCVPSLFILAVQVNGKRNVSPQSTDKLHRPANGKVAENSSWHQPAHGSQPPPGLVHQSHHGPTNRQQQGQRWNQAARGTHAAAVEPRIYSVQGGPQNGYSSAPKNVFADAVPSAGPPAMQRPPEAGPHLTQSHAPWRAQQPRQTAAAAHPVAIPTHAPPTRLPHAAGTGPGRPGMAMPVATRGSIQGDAPAGVHAAAGRGGTAPGLPAASSAAAPGGMPRQRPTSAGFAAGRAPGQPPAQSAAAQPRPLELHSPIRGGPGATTATPPSPQPTNSLSAPCYHTCSYYSFC